MKTLLFNSKHQELFVIALLSIFFMQICRLCIIKLIPFFWGLLVRLSVHLLNGYNIFKPLVCIIDLLKLRQFVMVIDKSPPRSDDNI